MRNNSSVMDTKIDSTLHLSSIANETFDQVSEEDQEEYLKFQKIVNKDQSFSPIIREEDIPNLSPIQEASESRLEVSANKQDTPRF